MRPAALVLMLLAAACAVGPDPDEYPAIATSAHGARGSLTLNDADAVEIELIEVRDSALVVLTPGGYSLALFGDIRNLDLPPHTSRVRQFRHYRSALDRLRPISRFPHGIPDGVLDQLLRSTGQSALTVLGEREP